MTREDPVTRINYLADQVTAALTSYPEGTATTAILGHYYWLGDGELYCSADAILEGQAITHPIDDINTHPGCGDFDGYCDDENVDDIIEALENWLESPHTVRLAEEWPLVPTWLDRPAPSPGPG